MKLQHKIKRTKNNIKNLSLVEYTLAEVIAEWRIQRRNRFRRLRGSYTLQEIGNMHGISRQAVAAALKGD